MIYDIWRIRHKIFRDFDIQTDRLISARRPDLVIIKKRKEKEILLYKSAIPLYLVGWLVCWVLWHINLCRLFNAKSTFIQIISSISNNSVYHEYTV